MAKKKTPRLVVSHKGTVVPVRRRTKITYSAEAVAEREYIAFRAGWLLSRGQQDIGQPDDARIYLAWRGYNATR